MRRLLGLAIITLSAGVLGGCAASPKPKEGFEDVQAKVRERTGRRVEWNQGTADDRRAEVAIGEILRRRPLSVDGAVSVSLLNNRSLQAMYENVGIAQADLVQAGLLSNPSFDFDAKFPTGGGQTKLESNVSQNVMDLLFIPLRKKLAASELEQAKLRVAGAVLRTVRDVEAAYYGVVAQERQLAMRREAVEAADASLILARRQHEAGTITDLQLAMDEGQYQQGRLDVTRLGQEVRVSREGLNRLMGLTTSPDRWVVATDLPAVPDEEWEAGRLEERAVAERLDLLAARGEVGGAETALRLGKWSVFTNVSPGVAFERETDGSSLVGPSIRAEVPLFDYGQGRVPRLEALVRQARRRLEAMEADTRSDVRTAVDRMRTARETAGVYRGDVIPRLQRVYDLTRRQFNAMTSTVHDLLLARTTELTAREAYVDAVRDYWVARADLEQAVGGRIVGPTTGPATTEPVAGAVR